jgi:hypothetical protein
MKEINQDNLLKKEEFELITSFLKHRDTAYKPNLPGTIIIGSENK